MKQEEKMIERFLSDELAGLRVKHPAKRLMTNPKEIAEHTGLDPQVVKESLSRMNGDGGSTKVVVAKAGNTDVVIRLAAKSRMGFFGRFRHKSEDELLTYIRAVKHELKRFKTMKVWW
ncbi:MAG: hypothetical protein HWN51_00735 [Desulfobacterales bacterium]|nr:hypothetical protein [Desulfobacterales bacterium]